MLAINVENERLAEKGKESPVRAFGEASTREVLHRELGEEHTRRLLRDAQAKLSHPHVVQVYEAREAEGQAMELVKGPPSGDASSPGEGYRS